MNDRNLPVQTLESFHPLKVLNYILTGAGYTILYFRIINRALLRKGLLVEKHSHGSKEPPIHYV